MEGSRRSRRRFTVEYKAEVVALCRGRRRAARPATRGVSGHERRATLGADELWGPTPCCLAFHPPHPEPHAHEQIGGRREAAGSDWAELTWRGTSLIGWTPLSITTDILAKLAQRLAVTDPSQGPHHRRTGSGNKPPPASNSSAISRCDLLVDEYGNCPRGDAAASVA